MNICGLDLSPTSPGLVKCELDDGLNIVSTERLGFCGVSKKKLEKETASKNIFHYDKDLQRYDRFNFILSRIFDFCKNVEYAAIEDYAYGGSGDLTQISEFAGAVKFFLYHQNTSIRLVDPQTVKYFSTGAGIATKKQMYDSYVSSIWNIIEKVDVNDLPILPASKEKSGISPTSDIIDSWFLMKVLHTELQLRKGLIKLSDLSDNQIKVFNRTTKAFPENILVRDFIKKEI